MARITAAGLALLAAPVDAILYKTAGPPMGWNSYNYYACEPTEEIIQSNAQGLVDLGFSDLGYQYVTTDCGWMTTDRDSEGRLQWNETLFPSGGEALGDYLHGLGLKFGLYSGAGYYQCGSTDLPASLGYEQIDAESFAGWGGDSLKYDNCYADDATTEVDYTSAISTSPARHAKMAAELNATDRDMAFFICQWGVGTDIEEWAPPLGDTFRISNDIYTAWRNMWRITNEVAPYWRSTRVGAYPDMDILIVGLGALSTEEEKFHFGMWAIQKSPLMMGAPANTSLTPAESLDILGNEEVVAINQDSLAKQARLIRRYTEEQWDIWAGELSDSRQVLAVANWLNDTQTVEVDLADVNVSSASARDVWAAEDLGTISGTQSFELAGHELRLLVLSDMVAANSTPVSSGYYAASNATYAGSAAEVACNVTECLPTGTKASLPSSGANVTFASVAASSDGQKLLGVDFVNYDISLDTSWDWGSNTRNMTVAVNGGTAKRWAYPISGGNWWQSDRMLIEVDGFTAGENEVVFAVYGDYAAPDLVGFELFE
ncbi:glycoside hydrolase superfamily [Xylariaceae sp. FL0804]|nr:glycoside hydrolase superfamily [Xylariaceae sp. FL0804]